MTYVRNLTYDMYNKVFVDLDPLEVRGYLVKEVTIYYSESKFEIMKRVIKDHHPQYLGILNRISLFK